MGPEGAINIVYKQEITRADDPQAKRDELIDEYMERYASPTWPERGYIDDIIEPKETRQEADLRPQRALQHKGASVDA